MKISLDTVSTQNAYFVLLLLAKHPDSSDADINALSYHHKALSRIPQSNARRCLEQLAAAGLATMTARPSQAHPDSTRTIPRYTITSEGLDALRHASFLLQQVLEEAKEVYENAPDD